MPLPDISPMPPIACGVGLPWDVEVADPVAAIAAARDEHGDTFVVDSGRDRYLFTFSASGVESFYALPEERASKGLADFRMLCRKLPDAIFDGRRILPSELFGRDDVAGYLTNLDAVLDATVHELGESGESDVFALTRRLGHRMGLASWAGPGCADGTVFERLVRAFDTLDGADAFVHPEAMAAVRASGKAAEITALDIALIHIASMSNLAAALGWLLVDLAGHDEEHARVAASDRDLAQRCALESTRLAQRSIMARYVHAPVEFTVEGTTHHVGVGATIATLLPLTNTTAASGLDQWQPTRWRRHRLADTSALASPQLVTSFGHGKHSCPAQPFSLAAMTLTASRLFATYAITPTWSAYPGPVPAPIGGVARAADVCTIGYRR